MKQVDFEMYWILLSRYWGRIILTGILVGGAVWAVSHYIIVPTYQANVTLYFGRIAPQQESSQAVHYSVEQGLNVGLQLIQDYCQLLKTKRIKDRVEEELNTVPAVRDTPFQVNIKLLNRTRLIQLNVDSHSPEVCKIVANAYAKVFINEAKTILDVQNAQVIDWAELPKMPIRPVAWRNAALGGICGIMLMYLLCFLHSLLDMRIKTPEQLLACLNLPVLGGIPEDSRFADSTYEISSIVAQEEAMSRKSNIAEYFHSLRVNLQYDDRMPENGAKMLVVTSSLPDEGKSFIASNLAVSFATVGKKVLLINCDLRRPTLHKIFGVSHPNGIVNVLVGEKTLDDAVTRNICKLPLDVLFCGPIPPNPSKLLGIKQFADIISEQKPHYDYIICDAPPILAVADAAVVGQLADGVLLVVRANVATNKIAGNALTLLRQAKMNVIGTVLNRIDCQADRYGDYSGRYGYGYGYGYRSDGDNTAETHTKTTRCRKFRQLARHLLPVPRRSTCD